MARFAELVQLLLSFSWASSFSFSSVRWYLLMSQRIA